MGGVGQRIKELRKASKLTQQELAEGVVTRSYISQIEKGLIQPSYDTLEKLAKRLNVTVEEFFKEPENMALVVTDWKKYIRVAEGQAESGLYDQAQRTLDNSNIEQNNELNDFDLGILAWVRGKLAEVKSEWGVAERFYKNSLEHLQSYMYVKERVRSMDSLAYIYWTKGRNEEALAVLNEAYSVLLQHQIGGLHRISVLVNSGIAYARLGEYHSAMRFLREADEINASLDADYKAGHILLTLGICYMQTEKYEEAEALYRRSIVYYQYKEDQENIAGTYCNLGILAQLQDNHQDAIDNLITSISFYEAASNRMRVANVRSGLAQSYHLNGEDEEARKVCRLLLDTAAEAPKYAGIAYEVLGDIARNNGDHVGVVEQYTKAQALFEQSGAEKEATRVLRKLGNLHYQIGNHAQSAYAFSQTWVPHQELVLL